MRTSVSICFGRVSSSRIVESDGKYLLNYTRMQLLSKVAVPATHSSSNGEGFGVSDSQQHSLVPVFPALSLSLCEEVFLCLFQIHV